MLKLKSILIATIIAAPVVINAADFKFYSSHRLGWYFVTEMPDSGDKLTSSTFDPYNPNTIAGLSRFGAKVKGEGYEGQVELAMPHQKDLSNKYTRVRQLWGKWAFTDNVGITIGFTDAPFSVKSNLQGYWEEVDQGKFCGKRSNNDKVLLYQLDLSKLGPIDAKFALIHNEGESKGISVSDSAGLPVDKKNQKVFGPVPKIQLKTSYSSDMISANFMGGFQTFTLKYKTINDSIAKREFSDAHDIGISSWAIGADVNLKVSIISLLVGFSYGSNTENMGINTSYSLIQAQYNDPSKKATSSSTSSGNTRAASPACVAFVEKNEVKSSTMLGVPASVQLNLSKKLAVIVGGGLSKTKEGKTKGMDNTQWSAYANVKMKPVAGLTVVPEIGFIDFGYEEKEMKASEKVSPQLFYGIFTQVDL